MDENVTTPMSQKTDQNLKKAAEITAILVGAFTIITILYNLINSMLPPRFEFAFTGASDPAQPVYELAAPLLWGGGQDVTLQLIVNADYAGQRVKGPVVIEVQTKSGRLIEVARWSEFQSMHHETRLVEFTLSDLYRYAELPKEQLSPNPSASVPFSGASSPVRVNVRHHNRVLASTAFQVMNAPWLHSVQLSANSVQAGQPVTAYITVQNYGSSGRFIVQAELYEIFPATSQIGPTLVPVDGRWTPNQTWKKKVFRTHVELPEPLPVGGQAVASIVLPAEQLQARRVYLLDTLVVKKLPYLTFPDGDWISSGDAWRASAGRQMAIIVVLEGG
jgi:hypothetical protein